MTSSPRLTAGEWMRESRSRLAALPGDEGALSTQVLLAHTLQKSRSWLLAHPEAQLTAGQQESLDLLLHGLEKGTPLPYLIGHWEFFGLDFRVSPDVLIPRPETELLVERAIAWLMAHPSKRKAADVGTGSACIAVSLLSHIPDLRCLAADRSWEALQMARQNAALHSVTQRINFLQGDLLSACSGPFDLVCANLPYIPQSNLTGLPVARHEPLLALDGGEDGLACIRQLVSDAPRWLSPGGLVLLEMQWDQGEAITSFARAHLPAAAIHILPDLAGLPRIVEIQM